MLRLTAALTSGDRGRAEDLVQETMLRAWTHRDNLDISHRCPQAWLTTVARHLAVDANRARRGRPPEAELEDELPSAGSYPIDARTDADALRAAIAILPGPQRQALTEVYYRDRSAAETARILHIPPGTVRSRIFYGLRALRHVLAAHDAVAEPLSAKPHPRQPRHMGTRRTPAAWQGPAARRREPDRGRQSANHG